jgi:hypothetical protein
MWTRARRHGVAGTQKWCVQPSIVCVTACVTSGVSVSCVDRAFATLNLCVAGLPARVNETPKCDSGDC